MMRRWRDEIGEVMKEIKSMKDWKEELRLIKEEIREEIREQGKLWRGEIDKFLKKWKAQEVKWKGKREEIRNCINLIETKNES